MINKVLCIRRVGRFSAFGNGSNDDLKFRKNTFIFGSNTHGKSTFTAILKSLHHQKPDYIIGRKTFGATDQQEVCLELGDGNKVQYKDGKWNNHFKIAIFDREYIAQNVFEGEKINHEKEQRIASIILGEDGYAFDQEYSKKLDECKKNSDEKTRITGEYNKTAEARQLTFEEFRKIKNDQSIDEKLKTKNKEIDTFANQEKICQELATLSEAIAVFQKKNFKQDLDETLEIKQDIIKQHILRHSAKEAGFTRFIALGLSYLKAKDKNEQRHCPFCSEKLGVDAEGLINEYNSLFSKEYEKLRNKLEAACLYFKNWEIDSILPERIAKLNKLGIDIDIGETIRLIRDDKNIFDGELAKKNDLNYKIDFVKLDSLHARLDNISNILEPFAKKYCQDLGGKKLDSLNEEAKKMALAKKRYESPYKEICEQYAELENTFANQLKPAKETAFKNKTEYSTKVFRLYEQKINNILQELSADFRLDNLKPSDKQRGEHTIFRLKFFNNDLAIVKLDGKEDEPIFKNSLSDSDKRLLAFAFFVACLQNKDDLSQFIVVLDDPMSSFDIDRKKSTIKILKDMLKGKNQKPVEQLIVLTHEPRFFELIHEIITDDVSFLRINYQGTEKTSIFSSCDINEEFLKDKYFCDIEKLRKMITANDEDVCGSDLHLMRICLEHVMQEKYYCLLQDRIKKNESIQGYIEGLKQQGIYDEDRVRKINDLWLHKSHHDQSNKIDVTALEPSEIRKIAKDFFEVIQLI